MQNIKRTLALIVLFSINFSGTAFTNDATNLRITPAVKVFSENKDAVVNINTTQVVRQQFGNLFGDPFFGQLFEPYQRDVERTSLGSGFVVHREGYIVTNAHVVDKADSVEVVFADGTIRPAKILASDTRNDLAILKVNPDGKQLKPVTLGTANDLMPGEPAIAIGNPLGYQHTVTRGIVSAVNRTMELSNDWKMKGLIQTDTPINPGNSGGPLFNAYGQLIGINTAIRGDAQNIGFAIPVNRLLELIPELMSPLLLNHTDFGGVFVEHRTIRGPSDIQVALSWKSDSTLKTNTNITRINNNAVNNIIEAYVSLLNIKPEKKLNIETKTGDKITLHAKALTTKDGLQIAVEKLGVELLEPNTAQRRQYRLGNAAGLLVGRMDRQGAFAIAGVRTGDFVVQVGNHRVSDLASLGVLLKHHRVDDYLDVYIVRRGSIGLARVKLKKT